jgi:hypothetical protein
MVRLRWWSGEVVVNLRWVWGLAMGQVRGLMSKLRAGWLMVVELSLTKEIWLVQAEMAVIMEMEITGEMRHGCWWWCGGEVDESWWQMMDSGRENGGRPVC